MAIMILQIYRAAVTNNGDALLGGADNLRGAAVRRMRATQSCADLKTFTEVGLRNSIDHVKILIMVLGLLRYATRCTCRAGASKLIVNQLAIAEHGQCDSGMLFVG